MNAPNTNTGSFSYCKTYLIPPNRPFRRTDLEANDSAVPERIWYGCLQAAAVRRVDPMRIGLAWSRLRCVGVLLAGLLCRVRGCLRRQDLLFVVLRLARDWSQTTNWSSHRVCIDNAVKLYL